MLLTIAATAIITLAAPAAEDDLSVRAIGSKCNHGNLKGTCQQNTVQFCGGISFTGNCPHDGATVQCCVNQGCKKPYQNSGYCTNTYKGCRGKFQKGYCPGDNNVQCCVLGTT